MKESEFRYVNKDYSDAHEKEAAEVIEMVKKFFNVSETITRITVDPKIKTMTDSRFGIDNNTYKFYGKYYLLHASKSIYGCYVAISLVDKTIFSARHTHFENALAELKAKVVEHIDMMSSFITDERGE